MISYFKNVAAKRNVPKGALGMRLLVWRRRRVLRHRHSTDTQQKRLIKSYDTHALASSSSCGWGRERASSAKRAPCCLTGGRREETLFRSTRSKSKQCSCAALWTRLLQKYNSDLSNGTSRRRCTLKEDCTHTARAKRSSWLTRTCVCVCVCVSHGCVNQYKSNAHLMYNSIGRIFCFFN